MEWTPLLYGRNALTLNPTEFHLSRCLSCKKASLWEEVDTSRDPADHSIGKMRHPATTTAPLPHPDLLEKCLPDYTEARSIAQASPRGAAALLRLCIQKLCAELGQSGKNLNDDIAALVKQGLPTQVQQALDIVRVTGNEAVHPGSMTESDHSERVNTLFKLVNIIVEQMISQPKRVADMYLSLPDGSRSAIEKRDANPAT